MPPRLRGPLAATVALGTALVLTACGSTSQADQASAAKDGAAASSSAAPPMKITDAQNRTVAVPSNPAVVVAMDWSAIRTLNGLGIKVAATPAPNGPLPEDLAAYAASDSPHVGTLFEPDYEAISALEPDLVVVGSRSGSPEIVAEMEKITPAVIDMSVRADDPADVVDLVEKRTLDLASIFGKTEVARASMKQVRDGVADVNRQATASKQTAMFVQVSGGKANVYGPGSRFGTVFEDYGFAPTTAPIKDGGSHGEEVSQEFFAKYNPGLLFVLDRAKAIGDTETPAVEVLQNGLVDGTDAGKNGKLVEVEGFSWYLASAAPQSLQQMTTDVAKAL
ncbi:MAG: ABC transporter substrate-binding protein [Humibacillus sp.]|nr:ABC transporter substrate-binding protein [Humibacillus sp.]MDN5779362.1 ABC transporter substrate-binding protein [Humibacillus sp.]